MAATLPVSSVIWKFGFVLTCFPGTQLSHIGRSMLLFSWWPLCCLGSKCILHFAKCVTSLARSNLFCPTKVHLNVFSKENLFGPFLVKLSHTPTKYEKMCLFLILEEEFYDLNPLIDSRCFRQYNFTGLIVQKVSPNIIQIPLIDMCVFLGCLSIVSLFPHQYYWHSSWICYFFRQCCKSFAVTRQKQKEWKTRWPPAFMNDKGKYGVTICRWTWECNFLMRTLSS